MGRYIEIPLETKYSHKLFIEWLNRLLVNYKTGFYDEAIKNLIELAFIKKHNSFLQEIYQRYGYDLSGFITFLPQDSTNKLLMVHSLGDGEPILYNSDAVSNLFDFDNNGAISKFYENVTIPLFDATGDSIATCTIIFKNYYGIKAPIIEIASNTGMIIGEGFLDVIYDTYESGSYLVDTTPIGDIEKYTITNVSKMVISLDIPILTDLSLSYEIAPNRSVEVPVTEWTTYFLKNAKSNGNIKVIKG